MLRACRYIMPLATSIAVLSTASMRASGRASLSGFSSGSALRPPACCASGPGCPLKKPLMMASCAEQGCLSPWAEDSQWQEEDVQKQDYHNRQGRRAQQIHYQHSGHCRW